MKYKGCSWVGATDHAAVVERVFHWADDSVGCLVALLAALKVVRKGSPTVARLDNRQAACSDGGSVEKLGKGRAVC